MSVQATNMQTKELPSRLFVYLDHKGPYRENPEIFGNVFTKVFDWAGPKGLFENGDFEMITVYYDDSNDENTRISIGVTMPADTVVDGDMQSVELPAGKYVIGSFEITPDKYGDAWHATMGYIMSNGMEMGYWPMYESYKNNPEEHPEGLHLVDLVIPVK